MPVPDRNHSYDDAPDALIARWQDRRAPLRFGPDEALPPLDTDLAMLAAQSLPKLAADTRPHGSTYARKRQALAADLAGGSELALLHAVLISCLRKRSFPAHAPALFRRLWAEQGAALIDQLSTRWLISAAITFADHGATELQRRLGQSLNMLFSLMKLYEFERLHGGLDPIRAAPRAPAKGAALPMGMTGFSLESGGLDINLLAPIWAEAQLDPLLGPLACHLLERLNADPGTLFRRLGALRAQAATRRQRGTQRMP